MRWLLWLIFQAGVAAAFIYWYDADPTAPKISLGAESLIGLGIAFVLTLILTKTTDLWRRLRVPRR